MISEFIEHKRSSIKGSLWIARVGILCIVVPLFGLTILWVFQTGLHVVQGDKLSSHFNVFYGLLEPDRSSLESSIDLHSLERINRIYDGGDDGILYCIESIENIIIATNETSQRQCAGMMEGLSHEVTVGDNLLPWPFGEKSALYLISHQASGQEYFAVQSLWGETGITLALFERKQIFDQHASLFEVVLTVLYLGAAGLILFIVWRTVDEALSPLVEFEADVAQLKHGETAQLTDKYPDELQPAANNIRLLIEADILEKRRYMNLMRNLNHAIFTPMATIRNLLAVNDEKLQKIGRQTVVVDDAIQRYFDRVKPEFREERVDPQKSIINVSDMVVQIIDALSDSFADKHITPRIEIDPELTWIDVTGKILYDIIDRLLNNAYRRALQLVQISVGRIWSEGAPILLIRITNDGEPMPAALCGQVLEFGELLDTVAIRPGGIGLLEAIEYVSELGGDVNLSTYALDQGAIVVIQLPLLS